MEIVDKTRYGGTKIRDLNDGTIFIYHDEVYMKASSMLTDCVNAVHFPYGSLCFCPQDELVYLCDGQLILQ